MRAREHAAPAKKPPPVRLFPLPQSVFAHRLRGDLRLTGFPRRRATRSSALRRILRPRPIRSYTRSTTPTSRGWWRADATGVARMYGWVGATPTRLGNVRPFVRLGVASIFVARQLSHLARGRGRGPTWLSFAAQRLGVYDSGASPRTRNRALRRGWYSNETSMEISRGAGLSKRTTPFPSVGRVEYRNFSSTLTTPGVRHVVAARLYELGKIILFCADGASASGPISDSTTSHEAWAFTGRRVRRPRHVGSRARSLRPFYAALRG